MIAYPSLPPARPRERVLLIVLAVLFFGPLLAPLFQATRLPWVADSGALARDLLAHYVCPTPAKSYVLLGFPMAVCARCWGATIGLWAAWWAVGGSRRSAVGSRQSLLQRLGWPPRLLLAALPFGLWVAEIAWWPAAPLWVLLLNGALAGCWAGVVVLRVFGDGGR